jgi:hypothetical protein
MATRVEQVQSWHGFPGIRLPIWAVDFVWKPATGYFLKLFSHPAKTKIVYFVAEG